MAGIKGVVVNMLNEIHQQIALLNNIKDPSR